MSECRSLDHSHEVTGPLHIIRQRRYRGATLDESLSFAFSQGEPDAVRRAYETYSALVFTVCLRSLQHRQDAEDACQRVFLRAWRSRNSYDPTRPLGAWLTGITRRVILDIYDERSRYSRVTETVEHNAQAVEAAPTLDQSVVDRVLVTDALERLKPPQGDILRMAFVQDLPQAEIARRLDMPVGTVKSHVNRGLRALRVLIGVSDGASAE